MKIRSLIFSLLMIFVGIAGAYSFVLPIQNVSAVSEDASLWDGEYPTQVSNYDFEMVTELGANPESAPDYNYVVGDIDGNGEYNNLYYIYSARGFAYFANQVSLGNTYAGETVYLCTDINLNGSSYKWTPIGISSNGNANYFAGTFDGQGYSIYNMTISGTYGGTNNYGQWAGLFSNINSATIKNVNLVNVDVSYTGQGANVGGLVGLSRNSSILNCSVSGSVTGNGDVNGNLQGVGGIVGTFYGDTSTTYDDEGNYSSKHRIANSRNMATVSGETNVGGIVGNTHDSVVILECFNEGEIKASSTGSSNNLGGIVGYTIANSTNSSLLVSYSYNAGNIVIDDATNSGGILGYGASQSNGYNSYFNIENSFNRGNFTYSSESAVSSSSRIGGIVGFSNRPNGGTTGNGAQTFSRIFNVGKVVNNSGEYTIPQSSTFSEIINVQQGAVIVGCEFVYYDSDYLYSYTNPDRISSWSLTSSNVTQILNNPALVEVSLMNDKFRTANFGGEVFLGDGISNVRDSDIWAMSSGINGGYPYLKNTYNLNNANNNSSSTVDNLWKGNGTKLSPYLIYTAGDLARVSEIYNNGYVNDEGGFVYDENENGENILGGDVINGKTITYFSLQNDIDLSSRAWAPIGNGREYSENEEYKFINAVFDGNDFTISGINCSLQANYSYLGLFGYAENSIIRNVKISDFRFIGTSSSETTIYKSTIVAYLDESYVINCADLTGGVEDTPTIGGSTTSSYLVYGLNNYIEGDNVFADNNLYGINDIKNITTLYLTYINTNGGVIYDTIIRDEINESGENIGEVIVHSGQAELLINTDGIIHKAINTSFGNTYLTKLPEDSIDSNGNLIENSVIIKEGNIIQYFKTDDKNNNPGADSISLPDGDGTSAIPNLVKSGLTASWGSVDDVTITINYNIYETENGYENIQSEQSEITFTSKYNEYWANRRFSENVLQELTNQDISRQGYQIVGIYTGFDTDFTGYNYLVNENSLESGVGLFLNYAQTFYVDWEGNSNYSISLNLIDSGDNSSLASTPLNYVWGDAVESVIVTFTATGGSITLTDDIISDGSTAFNYSTANVDLSDEAVEIQILLKEGFEFDINDEFLQNSGFVNAGTTGDYVEKFGSASLDHSNVNSNDYVYLPKEVLTIYLSNIVGNGSLSVNVRRSNHTYNLTVDNEIYFAITSPQAVNTATNISVLTGENSWEPLSNFSPETFQLIDDKSDFYFGVNLFDNYFLSSTDSYDRSEIPELFEVNYNNIVGEGILINIRDRSSASHYFLYVLTTETVSTPNPDDDGIRNVQTLYSISRDSASNLSYSYFIIEDMLASITEGYENAGNNGATENVSSKFYNFTYYTNSNFGIVFSTETDDAEIVDYQSRPEILMFNDANGNGEHDEGSPDDGTIAEEVRKIFYNFVWPTDTDNNGTTIESYYGFDISNLETVDEFTITQSKTTVSFDFKFATLEGDTLTDVTNTLENLPQIDISVGNTASGDLGNYFNSHGVSLNVNNYDYLTLTIKNTDSIMWQYRDFARISNVGKITSSTIDGNEILTIGSYLDTYLFITPKGSDGKYTLDGNIENPDSGGQSISYDPASYFSYSLIPAETDSNYLYEYTLSIAFPSDITPTDFDITFVVREVNFNISVSSIYKQTSQDTGYTDTTNETVISIDGEDNFDSSLTLKASDTFEISTNTENPGYTFNGFVVTKGSGSSYTETYFPPISHDEYGQTRLSMSMQEFLSYYKDNFTTLASSEDYDYTYTIRAVYVSKYLSYMASINRFVISNYNGYAGRFGLASGNIGNVDTNNLTTGVFYYYSENSNSSLTNGYFSLSLSSSASLRYEFTGFAILTSDEYALTSENFVTENGAIYLDESSSTFETDGSTITIYGSAVENYLKEKMSDINFINDYANSTVYIVPVVRQKTLQITINDGVTSSDIDNAVYNTEGTETTGTEIVMTYYYLLNSSLPISNAIYFGEENDNRGNYIASVNGGSYMSLILNDLFAYRVGYTSRSWAAFYGDRYIQTYSSNISLDNFFNSSYVSDDGLSDYKITVSRSWTPNTYTITYYSGDSRYNSDIYGTSTTANYSQTATYNVATTLLTNRFLITGYDFAGWEVYKVTADGTIYLGNYDENQDITNIITGADQIANEENFGTSLNVYATWTAKTYNITLNGNGGRFSNGNETLTLQLSYNQMFNSATVSKNQNITISNIENLFRVGTNEYILRDSFAFNGFYVSNDPSLTISVTNNITTSTYLRNNILTFVDNLDEALVVYATWRFTDVPSISFLNQVEYTYNGAPIEVGIDEFNIVADNLDVINGDAFSIAYSNANSGINVDFTFAGEPSQNIEIEEVSLTTGQGTTYLFTVGENVGTYTITLTISLIDNASTYYNLGTFTNLSTTFSIVINRADVTFSISENNAIWLKNLQYMVSLVGSSTEIAQFNNYTTFEDLRLDYVSKENYEFTANLVYEYLFMKYYNIINTKTSEIHTFKNWTYKDNDDNTTNDYFSYYGGISYFGEDENNTNWDGISQERQERAQILSNSLFVFGYTFGNDVSQVVLTGEDNSRYNVGDITLSFADSDNLITELQITTITVYSTRTMIPGNSYSVRAYLTDTELNAGNLNNYNLNTDANGQYYIELDNAYMFVQVLRLQNNSLARSTYYNGEIADVSWTSAEQEANGRIYFDGSILYPYEIDSELYNGLYLNLTIQTSNAGNADQDTEFNFYDKENYLNISNLIICTFGESSSSSDFTNYYSYFNVILDESFVFTIYNVVDTARIELSPTYFTRYNGIITNTDLPEDVLLSLENGLFSVTSFTYSLDNTTTQTYAENDSFGNAMPLSDGQYFSEDGSILLFTLEDNNSNAPIFYTSAAVVSVGIMINRSLLNQTIKYYGTFDSLLTDLENPYSATTEYNIILKTKTDEGIFQSDIEYADGAITDLNYYGVFSDMVRIDYDLNLPNVENIMHNLLKLNEDTVDNIINITYSNLSVTDLKYTINGVEQSYINLFEIQEEEPTVFIGADINDPHTFVTLKAYWEISELSLLQNQTEFNYAVGSMSSFYANLVGSMENEESDFFDYTYEFYLGENLLASSNNFATLVLNFNNGGSISDNGTYTLKFTVSIKDRYAYILDGTSASSVSGSLDFDINFFKNRLTNLEFVTESNEITYDGFDHINTFSIRLTYQVFDSDLNDYAEDLITAEYQYGTSNYLTIIVEKGGEIVTSIDNVGTYIIQVTLNENYFDFDADLIDTIFEFIVNRMNIDLSTYNLNRSKNFNADDPALTNTFRIANQNVQFNLERNMVDGVYPEDIGEYSLYLTSFTSQDNNNFTLSYGEVSLFDGTNYNEQNCETTPVGTLSIVKTGDLRISWQVSDNLSNTIPVDYDVNGYSVSITTDGNLIVYKGGEQEEVVSLVFYDLVQGQNITKEIVLNILLPLLDEIDVYLTTSGQNYDTAYNSGNYTFTLDIPENAEILNYYNSIYFSSEYTLQILSQTLNLDNFNFEKEFDGDDEIYLDINNNIIEDISQFDGIYIQGTFTDIHAGNNILLSVMLMSTDEETYSLVNYQLSASSAYGNILKRDAEITFTFNFPEGKSNFNYGDLTLDNLSSFISYEVFDGEEDVTDLFQSSYFNLNYTLTQQSGSVQTNSRGYVYVGEYTLDTISDYQDFNMTENLPSIIVLPYEYQLELDEGFISVTALDAVSSAYNETVFVEDTGDTFVVGFYVPNEIVGTTGQVGNYELTLNSDNNLYTSLYSSGNIRLTINQNNNAFSVVSFEGALYLQIDDESILTRPYNGQTYTITADETSFIITIENGNSQYSVSSTFSFFTYQDGSLVQIDNADLTFDEISITSSNTNEFSAVGSYRLNLSATAVGYTNVSFLSSYTFIIAPREITLSDGMFDKVYDGSNIVEVEATEDMGLIAGDSVTIRGIYQDVNAGDNKSVRVTLAGSSSRNYTLTTTTTVGKISKKDATISLVQDEFEYGDVTKNTSLSFEVFDGESIISSGAYQIISQTINYQGEGYLPYSEDSYSVSIVVESTNYNITPLSLNFHITKRQISFTFTSPGVYMASFGSDETLSEYFVRSYTTVYGDTIEIQFRRDEGTATGYYFVREASLNSSDEASNNYSISETVTDNVGAYRIVSSGNRIYLLASEEDVITDENEGIVLEFEYDGNSYNQVSLVLNAEEENYLLVVSNSDNPEISQTFVLNMYSYNEANGTYTRLTSVFDSTISANTISISDLILNAGNYYIYNSDVTSSNFAVKLGKNNMLFAFQITVTRRPVYFRDAVLERQFDNQNATLYYENANSILTNILNGDNLTLNIEFYDSDGAPARYAGEGYTLRGELSSSDNYQLVFTLNDGTPVTGTITKAPISIAINDQSVIYGDQNTQMGGVVITYQFQSETIDLTQYEKLDEMMLNIVLWDPVLNSEATYSSTGYLNAQVYNMRSDGLVSDDFYIDTNGFICNGTAGSNLITTYTVSPRTLNIVQRDEELQTIFTKYYDGGTTANIFTDGVLRFDFDGEIVGDVVSVESGNYATSAVGQQIAVSFTLIGADSGNYVLTPYTSGVINPITVSINYDKGGDSEEENNNIISSVPEGTPLLENMNYPFVYSDSLTSNSQTDSPLTSASFPSSLTGKEGHTFSHWSLDFEVTENSTEYDYLVRLASELNLTTSYQEGIFSFVVGNNRATVSLLNRLLSDEGNNYFGLYFLGQETIEITFHAVWATETYNVTVSLEKDGMPTTQFAETYVNDYLLPTASYQATYAYNSPLTIRAVLDDHIKVARFYDMATGSDYVDGEDGVEISTTLNSETNKYETTFYVASLSRAMNIVVEFAYKDVSITLDLTSYGIGEVTFDDDRFTEYSTNRYVWNTSYDELNNLSLSNLPELTRVGFIVTNYSFSMGTGSTEISADVFDSRFISDFVYPSGDDYEIVYSPIFLGHDVNVILNYNEDGNYQNDDTDQKVNIQVPYQGTFGSSSEWIETPTRTGYDFVGWFLSESSEDAITGESVVDNDAGIVLYARWQIQQNTVYLTFDDMTLNGAKINDIDVDFTIDNGTYIFENLTFNDTLILEFTLQAGFNINSVSYHYLDGEDIEVLSFRTEDNIGIVEFTIPARPEVYLEVNSGLNENEIRITGDNILSVTATDTQGNPFEIIDNSFVVDTNVDIIIQVTFTPGYVYVSSSLTSNYNETYDEENNILTIELYNITSSMEIALVTRVRQNQISVEFATPSHLEQFVVNNMIISSELVFEVDTGEPFAFYVQITHGYKTSVEEIVSSVQDTEIQVSVVNDASSLYNGYFYVVINNIYSDIDLIINTSKQSYTVQVVTINYDENMQLVENARNTAFVNGESEVTMEFESEVELSANAYDDYGFAGFSLDGLSVFTSDNPATYVVEDNVIIYAIFSKLRYNLTFLSYNYYQLDSGSGSGGEEKYELIYQQIFYANEDRTQTINETTLFYGASITLYLTIPSGYNFYGFGYYEVNNPNRTYIVRDEVTEDRLVDIYISADEFLDVENTNIIVFVALSPIEVEINVSSWLDYDGSYEEDDRAGNISLVDENAGEVNSNGYVTGTNNHYSSSSFNGGNPDVRDFTVISYTNSTIYLKIYAERDGYYFTRVSATPNITINALGRFDEGGVGYYLYQFAGFIGGTPLDIQVYFKAEKKIIDYNFVNENGDIVVGGNLRLEVDAENSNKVWSDGTNFSSMTVTGFIDTNYTVVAYVRLGFMIDENASFITYDDSVVTVSNISFDQVLSEVSNYTYILRFNVSGYKDNTTININLVPQTYTVLLKDTSIETDAETSDILLEIRNVKFHELLNLSVDNSENLIFDEELFDYRNGVLSVVQTKDDYSFGGYFTRENGQGRQYINASGEAIYDFMETGYILDETNNIYVLAENAEIVDGQVVITLYLYWVYLKTQITFELIPETNLNIDALDIVNGVNEYNSWFNEDIPFYLEVAFDTNLTFTAPELSGYSFYRFVIRQCDANGNWLSDVVSYQSSVPWSTNEFDQIVQVEVQIYYFAKVDVLLYGGEMEYEIRQITDDNAARTLLSQGYVDTTKEFTLSALDSDGYTFQYWINATNNMRYDTKEVTLTITSRTTFFLYCQGKSIVLRFDEYDATNGQIVILEINSRLSGISNRALGIYNDDGFVKTTTSVNVRVGDTVTFLTSIDFGYGAEWNIDGVELTRMTSEYYYFTVTLDETFANQSIQVIPTFSGESVAFYIQQDFSEEDYLENATDNNNAANAGYFVYQNENTSVVIDSIFVNININVVLNMRYAVKEIRVMSYSGESIDVTECYNSQTGLLSFTPAFMAENNIAGTLILEVIYDRLYFTYIGEFEEHGNGQEDNPYLISSVEDLTYYMQKINNGEVNADGLKYSEASYRLTASLNLAEKFWTPIGTEENPFNGTFSFNGYTITSVYLARLYNSTSYGGLFGVLGENARFIQSEQNFWYIYVIVGVVAFLIILLVILLLWNRNRKKRREEMERR